MTRMHLMPSRAYRRALRKAEAMRRRRSGRKEGADAPFSSLNAVKSTSIIGQHNGVMDDDLLELIDGVHA